AGHGHPVVAVVRGRGRATGGEMWTVRFLRYGFALGTIGRPIHGPGTDQKFAKHRIVKGREPSPLDAPRVVVGEACTGYGGSWSVRALGSRRSGRGCSVCAIAGSGRA